MKVFFESVIILILKKILFRSVTYLTYYKKKHSKSVKNLTSSEIISESQFLRLCVQVL